VVRQKGFVMKLNAVLHYSEEALERFLLQFPVSMVLRLLFSDCQVPYRQHEKFEKLFQILPAMLAKCLLKLIDPCDFKRQQRKNKNCSGLYSGIKWSCRE
jgi:hypothetical protein